MLKKTIISAVFGSVVLLSASVTVPSQASTSSKVCSTTTGSQSSDVTKDEDVTFQVSWCFSCPKEKDGSRGTARHGEGRASDGDFKGNFYGTPAPQKCTCVSLYNPVLKKTYSSCNSACKKDPPKPDSSSGTPIV